MSKSELREKLEKIKKEREKLEREERELREKIQRKERKKEEDEEEDELEKLLKEILEKGRETEKRIEKTKEKYLEIKKSSPELVFKGYDKDIEELKKPKKVAPRKGYRYFGGKLYNKYNMSYQYEPIPVIDVLKDVNSKIIMESVEKERKNAKRKYKHGYELKAEIKIVGSDYNVISSYSLKDDQITKENIENILDIIAGKNFSTEDYIGYFGGVEFWVSKKTQKGGCNLSKQRKVHDERFQVSKYIEIKLTSLKSKNNNCGIVCLLNGNNLKANEIKQDMIRKELGIKLNTKLDVDQMGMVADYLHEKYNGKGYVIYDERKKVLKYNLYNEEKNEENIEENKVVQICLWNEHYWMVDIIKKKRCEKCGRILLVENKDHNLYCDPRKINYMKIKDRVKKKYIIEDEELDYSNKVIFFDLETFQEEDRHVAYACGWMNGESYRYTYGKNCIKEFVEEIIKTEDKIITAYNGSGFDFYFLINELMEKNVKVKKKSIIINNGKILKFEFGKGNKFFDLYQFVRSSLDEACKDFNLEYKKSKFDHNKIKTWKDVEEYKNEVLPNLELDVKSLKELFIKFNETIYEQEKINITSYVTLSHMGYNIWSSKLGDTYIEIPDKERYEFIKRGSYGARCYPLKKNFKSKYYDDVVSGKMKYEELIKTKDFVYNGDVSSLYSAAMRGFKLCEVKYPVGKGKWSNEQEKIYNEGYLGYYHIKFSCPKNIRIPILPRKNKQKGLIWSLEDGEGVYTNVDIEDAIKHGYKIEFTDHECLYWEESHSNLFTNYINKFYELKNKAEKEKNPVIKGIAKLLMNSLYGKMLQKAIYKEIEIVNNMYDLHKFYDKHDDIEYIPFDDNKIMVTGELNNEFDKENKISKPCHIGTFILSYSRRIMLRYIEAISPDLTEMPMTYTDTDSLHLTGENYYKLKEMGLIKLKKDVTIGYLCSDIDDEGIIIKEINLAPKVYRYEFINNKNKVFINENCIMKSKGIPRKTLTYEMYDKEEPVEKSFHGLKKKHLKLTNKDKIEGIENFSIINQNSTRTFMKNIWSSMVFKDNQWFPFGCDKLVLNF